MTFGSLFSGIGGFDLGLERAGMECLWQVEIDPYCRKVLAKHWPDVPRYEDVKDVGARRLAVAGWGDLAPNRSADTALAPVDLICGGFPCQDLSVAGNRAGLDGARSGLWFEFRRIVSELRPTWVLIENVPGLRSGCGCVGCRAVGRLLRVHRRIRERKRVEKCSVCHAGERMLRSHSGRNMAVVLHGLAELGYVGAWRSPDSQFFGVAQRRERVFLLAVRDLGAGCPAEILAIPEGLSGHPAPSREARSGVAGTLEARAATGGYDPGAHGAASGHIQLGTPLVAQGFHWQASAHQSLNPGPVSPALDKSKSPAVAYALGSHAGAADADVSNKNHAAGGPTSMGISEERAHSLRGGRTQGVVHTVPHRLTPRECERLQAFPDDWTRWDSEGNELADSPRYRMLGNAVTVNVAHWLGQRIMEAP